MLFYCFAWLNSTGKNVAADIAEKLCNSVADKLEGKVIGTFDGRFTFMKYMVRQLYMITS